ncbi:MAG TPA: hypothetical protein VNP04_27065 [Alphaproteobacteria bacterium]|nr:hypothetical protein [Alphaproteobacteria bacterium]
MDLGPAIVERWGEDGVRALAVYRRVARKITAAIDALPESERKAVHKELYDHLVVPIENGTADLDPAALRRRVGEIWLRLAERFGIEIPELLLNRINRPQLEAAVA